MPDPDQKLQTDHLAHQVTSPTDASAPTEAPETSAPDAEQTGQEPALGDTTGMGTVLALGCIGGTAFLIVLGLIYLLITQLFG